ncbi:IclR family transcriptional regulator [Primorskyibacter sp. 2E107]|uniref:IclR family transcriptional regulator n=1 Tax=Primorskyibacter sp. 2E107 TaxID=3403458 RepID=UPI003AF5DC8C
MTPLPDTKDRRFATTLARGLMVLRAFRASDDGLGNAEISERTGLPKSTVSRLTFTLRSLGYLTHARRHDRYRPGPALLALGNVAQASISFVDVCAPIMQRMADETGTLALLLVRDNAKLLILRTWRPRGVSSLWLEAGHRLPFAGTSSGHTMLAAMSEELFETTVANALGDRGLTQERANAARRMAYDQLITRGFAITPPDQYFAANIHAVSKPFHARDFAEPVVFTAGAMPDDLSVARMEAEVGPRLNEAVMELERMMGQPPSITLRN